MVQSLSSTSSLGKITTIAKSHQRHASGAGEALREGEPAVREHTIRVVLDVVQRYDIDGVHIDDYFYPYKEKDRRGRTIEFPDATSWRKYVRSGGRLSRDD
ncbi:MAG: hypothetical protein DMD39_05635 [Gemmatimonadetes bacterium]|nr:MAG: hypothetical protein DMD39_05635 [Gemmatimonadota bacterium]